MPGVVEIFISFHPKDEKYLLQLEQSLKTWVREGIIKIWHKGYILAGEELEDEASNYLNSAHIIILLLSKKFIASEECFQESTKAMERLQIKKARVIPVLLEQIAGWQNLSFSRLRPLPKDGRPVKDWRDRKEAAFVDIAEGIKAVVDELQVSLLSSTVGKEEVNIQFSKAAEPEPSIMLMDVLLPIPRRPDPEPEPLAKPVPIAAKPNRVAMRFTSSDVLTNQVIRILTSYIPYLGKAEESMTKPQVSEDDFNKGREVYETVDAYFQKMNDGGATRSVLDNFIKYPKFYRDLLKETLNNLLRNDPHFANKLRSIISFFIAREQELEAYVDFLSGSNPWIWSFTGLEGSGKTHLLDQMKERTPDIPVVRLNFAAERPYDSSVGERSSIDVILYIEKFATQMSEYCNSQQYKDFENKCRATRQDYNQVVIKQIRQAGSISDNPGKELWREVLMRATIAFHELMETFQASRLIIQLDSCEWLMEPVNVGVRKWLIEELLRPLHEKMRQLGKALHVVIMSSVNMDLFLLKDQVRFSKLGPLNEKAVEEYLERIGVEDAKLRKQFYEMTEGHTICSKILCNLWQQWKKEGKLLPRWEEENSFSDTNTLVRFQKEFYEKIYIEFIRSNILVKFDKSLQKLIQFGPILRDFDRSKFVAVFPEEEKIFEQFIGLPYIENKKDSKYEMLGLFRATFGYPNLMQFKREWQVYHQRAREYLSKKHPDPIKLSALSDPSELADLLDWCYHSLALILGEATEDEALLYLQVNLDMLKERGVEWITLLVDAACDKTLMFTKIAFAAQKYRREVLREG